MSRISASAASAILLFLLIASTLPASASDAASPSAISTSKVRIVRLSEVKGEVKVDLANGHGFEDAMPNLPIVEQMRLATGDGVAEVEFEDNSTLRLAPNSLVEFPRLELLSTGTKASTIHVLKGMVYVSMVGTRGNDFALLFGQHKLDLLPTSHIRLEIARSEARMAVLEGAVQIDGPAGPTNVAKKKTVTFPLLNQDTSQVQSQSQPIVTKNVSETNYDSWDHDAADYHKRFAVYTALNNSSTSGNGGAYGSGYGVSDMMYYGNFSNAGGCGSMWHPYFAGSSWEPYSNGAWAYYQGAGYSWVSPYPWAWTPYHSGTWAYCPGAGWGWQPGSNWNGLSNAPINLTQFTHRPVKPGRPPVSSESSLLRVNSLPLTASSLKSENSFVFRKDSAGLGVPRGTMGDLTRISQRSVQRGSVTAPVYQDIAASSGAAWSGAGGQMARPGSFSVASVRRGYAAPAESASWASASQPGVPQSSATLASSASSGHASASSGSGSSHPK